MKAVVSSLVALAIAIASPLTLAAGGHPSHDKPVAAKTHKSKTKAKKKKPRKKARHERRTRTKVRREHHEKVRHEHGEAHAKRTRKHHDGIGIDRPHSEPKIDHRDDLVPASLVSHHADREAMPKLPPPDEECRCGDERTSKKDERTSKKGERAHESRPKKKALEHVVAKRRSEPRTTLRHERGKKEAPPCETAPVEIIRGPEVQRFALTTCAGEPARFAVERLSLMIRPGKADRPTASLDELAKKKGAMIARGVRRVDPGLVQRLAAIVAHFSKKDGAVPKIDVISGYRPASTGSKHQTGRAIDFRIEGIKNEAIVAFCKKLDDTGCGYYPNSSFVHLDVRAGAGHVSWIDASGPGESPRYVSSWPPPAARSTAEHATPEEDVEHPSEVEDAPEAPDDSED